MTIHIPEVLRSRFSRRAMEVHLFLQSMVNRLLVGQLRYGEADRRQKYLVRLSKELKAYKETGNAEHLFNIANYALLEFLIPTHKNFHIDTTIESVTRDDGS